MRPPDKQDLNNASVLAIKNYLLQKDPLRAGTDAEQRYARTGPGHRRLSRQDQRRRADIRWTN